MNEYKIGFTIGNQWTHRGGIWPGNPKFKKLFEYFTEKSIECETIETELTEEVVDHYDLIVVGSGGNRFTVTECDVLRQYINDGHSLFIALKFGGDHHSDTKISRLFPEIQLNDDEVIDPIYIKRGIKSKRSYGPIIPIFINEPSLNLHFQGRIQYDSGCTFSVNEGTDLTIPVPENFSSWPHPRKKHAVEDSIIDNLQRAYDANKLTQIKGPILVYKRIGQGSVLYWGARWSFSDDYWDKYDNSRFFIAIMELFLGTKLPIED